MKNRLAVFSMMLIALLLSAHVCAQMTGSYTILGSYASIALAVADLNTLGATGGVTFNVAANYTETVTAPILITATGAAGNVVTFQKDPATSGLNPIITRTDAGTLTTTT